MRGSKSAVISRAACSASVCAGDPPVGVPGSAEKGILFFDTHSSILNILIDVCLTSLSHLTALPYSHYKK